MPLPAAAAHLQSLLPIKRSTSCRATTSNNSAPSSSDKIGSRIRVKVPVKVHHVVKLPGLDLNGMVGTVRQYAGVWKGRKITPNLPFKVEFLADGTSEKVKFFAHLRQGEFEDVIDDDDAEQL